MYSTGIGYTDIPVEVFVKFFESGDYRPVKLVYGDDMYYIERILDVQPTRAQRVNSSAPRIFTCLIAGHKRQLYFYADQGRWCIKKPTYSS